MLEPFESGAWNIYDAFLFVWHNVNLSIHHFNTLQDVVKPFII